MKKLSNITESIWSDMQDRSSGEKIRQEDDVNRLDIYGLKEYLENNYIKHEKSFRGKLDIIDIDEFRKDLPVLNVNMFTLDIPKEGTSYLFMDIYLSYSMIKNMIYLSKHVGYLEDLPKFAPNLYKKLLKNFKVTKDFIISPKNKQKIDNLFFKEVLDFIIDNVDTSITKNISK